MYFKRLIVVLCLIACVGCGTTYIYEGSYKGVDADGETRDHNVYWNKTERTLWFDVSSKTMWLCSEGVLLVLTFRDTEDGVVFEGGPKDVSPDGTKAMTGEVCGRVLNVEKIKDLTEGEILIEIYCKYEKDDFDTALNTYLAPGDEAYPFDIIKAEGKILEGDGPSCR